MTMLKAGVWIFMMTWLSRAYSASRTEITISGTTVGPDFDRKSETVSPSCPESHPYPFNDYSQCCTDKLRMPSGNCPGSTGEDSFLIGSDPPACCNSGSALQCPYHKCKMHPKGFEQAHVVLIGNTGTYAWNFGKIGRRFTNLLPWPQGANGFFMQQQAVEYPPGSMQIVICGGTDNLDGIWWTTNECHQFDLVNNAWSAFASLLVSTKTGVLKVVGGTLFSLGGHHRHQANSAQSIQKRTERYVDSSDSWVEGHDMPIPLAHLAAEVLNGQEMILAGGYTTGAINVNNVYLFNPFTGAYVEKAPLSFARQSIGTAKISLDGGLSTGIIFLGGVTLTNGVPVSSHDVVEIFKVEDNSYIRGDHLKFPGGDRFVDGQMVSVDGQVFLFGARSIPGHTNTNDNASRELWKFQGVDSNPTWTLESTDLPSVTTIGVTNAVVVMDKEPFVYS